MTHHLESIAGFTSTIVAAIFGAVTVPSLAEIVTNDGLPEWAKWLLGPLGALIGMIIAIKWLTARLDKAEARETARQTERDEQLKTLVTLGVNSNTVISQNSEVMESVKTALERIKQ